MSCVPAEHVVLARLALVITRRPLAVVVDEARAGIVAVRETDVTSNVHDQGLEVDGVVVLIDLYTVIQQSNTLRIAERSCGRTIVVAVALDLQTCFR